MDDVIADFKGHPEFKGIGVTDITVARMYRPGFFRELAPVGGSLVAVRELIRMGYDVQLLTQPVAESPHSYLEKVQWVGMWFPELINKINMVQDKGIVRGDYLIDDNLPKWATKFESGGGKFIHFPYNLGDKTCHSNEEIWKRIVFFFNDELKRG